ncbi:MAG: TIGR01458 family HAD-type hydrolase, partial [Candidatus Helarchaeota archaeon]
MTEIKAFLIDLAGVIHIGNKLINGAIDIIEFLNKNNYAYKFISNTTQKRRKTISEKLSKLGLEIKETDIFTPTIAAIERMKKENKNRCFLLSTKDIREDFQKEKIILTEEKVDYVIIGDAAENFTFNQMNKAFRLIMDGARILALEKDRYYMGDDGLYLSAGPFVTALEYATGKEAIVVGKPSKDFFKLGLNALGSKSEETIMIGDDIF